MTQNQSVHHFRYFDVVASLFVAISLISIVAAGKLFSMGPFTFTAAIILFPIQYIAGDILTEVYGYARARRVIWLGFMANIMLSLTLGIAIILPPADGWPLQEAFAAIHKQVPRLVVASLLAYVCGEFFNSLVMAKMKLLTKGKHLWTRTIGSTVVGQGVDSVIFVVVAFWGVLPGNVLFTMIWSAYLFKVLYEIVATPMTYYVVGKLKRLEHVDYYDRDTKFTPFSFKY